MAGRARLAETESVGVLGAGPGPDLGSGAAAPLETGRDSPGLAQSLVGQRAAEALPTRNLLERREGPLSSGGLAVAAGPPNPAPRTPVMVAQEGPLDPLWPAVAGRVEGLVEEQGPLGPLAIPRRPVQAAAAAGGTLVGQAALVEQVGLPPLVAEAVAVEHRIVPVELVAPVPSGSLPGSRGRSCD